MNERRHIRRSHPRARVPSIAFFVVDGRRAVGPLVVENLSAGGALLTGEVDAFDTTLGARFGAGRSVIVQLELPDVARRIHVRATIVREAFDRAGRTDTATFAVKFRDVSAEDEDIIHTSVLHTLQEESESASAAAVIFDDCSEDRALLARVLVDLGHRALHAATFLEIVRLLEHPSIEVHTVLVDASVRRPTGLHVLELLRDEFPHVGRVLTGRAGVERKLGVVLSVGLAHAIVAKPPSQQAIARVMARRRATK